MGRIQSKLQQSDPVDADHELSARLRSTLKDLEKLFIRPQRLKIKEDHEVGCGGYGVVKLATLDKSSRNSREVAVKQLNAEGTKRGRLRLALRLVKELKVWATLQHQNILELLGYYLSDDYAIAQLISVYMVNGNVSEYLVKHQPDTATRLRFVQGITAGLQYLHDFNPPISHGDLKPANVLINDDIDVVICDFGVASFIDQTATSSGLTTTRGVKGSPRYMSPELFKDGQLKHNLQTDIWSWACTIYEIFTNIEPYSGANGQGALVWEMVQKQAPGSIQVLLSRLPRGETWPTMLSEVINDCWNFDSNKRPSVTTLIGAIETPSNVTADRFKELPPLPTGGAEPDSWSFVELELEDSHSNHPAVLLGGDKLKV